MAPSKIKIGVKIILRSVELVVSQRLKSLKLKEGEWEVNSAFAKF